MISTEFGLSELYQVVIRATYPIEVGGKTIESGEVLCAFDRIQIGNVNEIRNTVSAHGGWDDRGYVYWDSTREVQITFQQGIFSKTQLMLLTSAKLTGVGTSGLKLHKREELESGENGIITLSHAAIAPIFVYSLTDGTKLEYTIVDETHLKIADAFMSVLVDYQYLYNNNYKIITVGQMLTSGFLTLEGKSRIKDDETGQTHTVLLYVPKLKLMSNLSMRLGQNAMPQIGTFSAIAIPTGDRRHEAEVMHVVFLDDDIDSDI